MTNYKDLLMKLPSAVRPKMLSCVVREELIDCQSAATLSSEKLSSPEFCSGVIRLIRDVNFQNEEFDEEVIARVESGLLGIDIRIASNLRTTLLCNDYSIPGSEARVPHLLKKT